MDPFKTGLTGLFATALVSLGKSGRFTWCGTKTGRNCNPASFLSREESVHNGLDFIGYGMDRNYRKWFMANLD